jgi:uncharacterized protein YciI
MWFLSLNRNLVPPAERTVSLDEHLAWVQRAHENGSVVMSGPSADRRGAIYVVRSGSLEEAQALMDADPFSSAGCTSVELIEWEVHQLLGVGTFSEAARNALDEANRLPDEDASAHRTSATGR